MQTVSSNPAMAGANATAPAGAVDQGSPAEVPAGERELVLKLAQQFERDVRHDSPLMQDFNKWRDYLRGKTHGGNFCVNVNLCQSTMNVLVPRLYARNPDVSVTPADSVHPARFEDVRAFGRTAEIMVGREWRRARLKSRIKRQIRGTLTVGFAWLKAAMQIDLERDVVMEKRANDLQDNLADIDRRMQLLEQGSTDYGTLELQREELVMAQRAAQAKLEVERARGMVFANPRQEDVIVSGEIRELIDYLDADRITHRIWMKADVVATAFSLSEDQLRTATRYQLQGESSAPTTVQKDETGQWVAVLEVWDRKGGQVHTFIHGCDYFLRPSSPPNPSSRRFYPFFLLAWDWVDDTRLPLSAVGQWAPLQDEYNSVRSGFRTHRKRSLPGLVVNGAVVNEADAARITNNEAMETIVLQGVPPDVPLDSVIREKQLPAIDGALYDVRPILYDLDVVSGVQEAARQAIKTAKTATEAEIQETAGAGRTEERNDAIEEQLADLAEYCLELMLQSYTEDDAIRIAGDGAVWPELTIDEMHQLAAVSIGAGSTGKPDTAKRQQTWGVLLPVVREMVEKIHGLRQQAAGATAVDPATGAAVQSPPNPAAGMLADALEELLKETIKRSDERIDVDRFLPMEQQPVAPPAVTVTPPTPIAPVSAPAGLPAGAIPA